VEHHPRRGADLHHRRRARLNHLGPRREAAVQGVVPEDGSAGAPQEALLPGCTTCHLMDEYYTAVIGSVMTGDWLLRTMSMSGDNGAQAYNPSKEIAIAVFATYEQAFYDKPKQGNQAEVLFRQIGAIAAPRPHRPSGRPPRRGPHCPPARRVHEVDPART
jgi:hypothetical protein